MPLFGSGASKIILCLPLIRFSHVSNDASAPVVGSGRGCPSSLSGVSPATPAAAVAARRPRNPRLYMRSLLVVRPCGIGDIGWWIAAWPIVLLAPLIGSRVRCGRGDRDVAGQERQIGHNVSHVRARRVERRPIHAATKAVVDAILDGLDHPAARAILRITREYADPRPIFTAAFVEMAARAAELVGRSEEHTSE